MVIPIYDDDPLDRGARPYVTYAIIAANIAIFLIETGAGTAAQTAILVNFALFPVAVTGDVATGSVTPTALAALTYMFLHAGWLHIFFNMLFLWVFGDNIEDALGPLRFAVFYLACGVAAALTYVASDPASSAPLVGASGAVAGIVGAYLMLRPCAKVRVLVGPVPVSLDAFWVLGFWVLVQIWHVLANDEPGVAWWAHIGGLAAGALLVIVMRPRGVVLFECMRPQDPAPPLAKIGEGTSRGVR
ncbi:MAG: rhomboid family intramembrane serine protease [Proteobacteria bacterium]|nr:rhomboid family intramembrane serine protease [Pseudomonadota bacterium]